MYSDCIVIAEKLEKQLKKLKKRITTNGLSSSNIKNIKLIKYYQNPKENY